MKLFDEKGRLFGRLNIIDLLVIIIVIIIAAVGLSRSRGVIGSVSTGSVTMTYTAMSEGVRPEAYESMLSHIPSQLMAAGKYVDGRIVSAEAVPCKIVIYDEKGGVSVIEDENLINVIFTVEVEVAKLGVMINEVGTQEVRVGKSHIIKTEFIEADSMVLSLEYDE